jgi:hypothetical protein
VEIVFRRCCGKTSCDLCGELTSRAARRAVPVGVDALSRFATCLGVELALPDVVVIASVRLHRESLALLLAARAST